MGHHGALGTHRGCRETVLGSVSGTSGGVGVSGVYWGLAGTLGTQGLQGVYRHWGLVGVVRGIRGCIMGGKWTGSPTTLDPSLGSQHSHCFPWESDLPGQSQASDRNELCRLLYTLWTIFHGSFHICIHATSSHIFIHNIRKCSVDYFLCRPIYTYHYMMNVTYYDTMVLITNNYFSHQISDLVHLPWLNVHSSIFDTDLV